MTNQPIKTIQFNNQSLIVLNHQNKPYVAMKPICENIGLDWHAQRQRIHRHQVLSRCEVMITAVAQDGKTREILCLPISMINGWLFGIDTNRVKPEIRPTLEKYQLECFEVLYNHFMPKVAQQYPITINLEQQQAIRQAVSQRAYRNGEHHQAVYHKLYEEFKIPRYQDLPASRFEEAIRFLGGVKINHIQFTDDELYKISRLFFISYKMHNGICDITPALEKIFSKYADRFHDMAFHFKRELNEARLIIERETSHISDKGFTNKWNGVLAIIRSNNRGITHE